MTVRKVHPAAAVWPMLPDDLLRELADDIAAHGLLDPITVDSNGTIIDGRNRLAACELAGVEPSFKKMNGTDVHAVIISRNVRRHMTPGARAMATAVNLADAGLRENGRWKRGAIGESANSDSGWSARMKEAGLVFDHADGLLIRDVIEGRVALSKAYEETKNALADIERQRRQLATLTEKAPDLAAKVDAGDMPLDEAVLLDTHRRREEIAAEEARLEALTANCTTFFKFVSQFSMLNIDADYRASYDESGLPHVTADEIDGALETLTDIAKQWRN